MKNNYEYTRNKMKNKMTKISLYVGDITKLSVDAIVCSANPYLIKGSGVSGVIHRAAGEDMEKECKAWLAKKELDVMPKGDVMITAGYDLAIPHVIHTVGSVYMHVAGREAELLELLQKQSHYRAR